ncbi:MAG: hypothetical protein JNG83_11045 [Opitutaceae bacterium]|nr:hypothetical protein [Opitutaceae bacterium]
MTTAPESLSAARPAAGLRREEAIRLFRWIATFGGAALGGCARDYLDRIAAGIPPAAPAAPARTDSAVPFPLGGPTSPDFHG